MISICSGWEFSGNWSEEFLRGEGSYPVVDLPHNVKEISLHYASPSDYEGIYGYRRIIECGRELAGKRVILQLDGAAHIAQVYLNGNLLSEHRCGYTSFRTELTGHLNEGPNVLAVRLDSTENKEIPPFGFVIDYLTYSGLYREAWLDVKEQSFIDDVFVSTPDLKTVRAEVKTEGDARECRLTVLDGEKQLATVSGKSGEFTMSCTDAESWHVDHPKLYTLRTELLDDDGKPVDRRDDTFGFRTAVFKAVSEGARSFDVLAIAAKTKAWPCGACRQVLNEFAPELRILITWEDHVEEKSLSELLPEGFGPQSM